MWTASQLMSHPAAKIVADFLTHITIFKSSGLYSTVEQALNIFWLVDCYFILLIVHYYKFSEIKAQTDKSINQSWQISTVYIQCLCITVNNHSCSRPNDFSQNVWKMTWLVDQSQICSLWSITFLSGWTQPFVFYCSHWQLFLELHDHRDHKNFVNLLHFVRQRGI